MPQPRIREYDDHIRMRWAEGSKPSVIFRELQEKAGSEVPPISEKTIRRRFEEYGKLPARVRDEWRRFQWPEAMESGVIPWADGKAALDLVRYRRNKGHSHPTVRLVRWWVRLRQACPTVPDDDAEYWAEWLATRDFAIDTGIATHTDFGFDDLLERLVTGDWGGQRLMTYQGGPGGWGVVSELLQQRLGPELARTHEPDLQELRRDVAQFDEEAHRDD